MIRRKSPDFTFSLLASFTACSSKGTSTGSSTASSAFSPPPSSTGAGTTASVDKASFTALAISTSFAYLL